MRGGRGSSCLKRKKISRTCFLGSLAMIHSHPSHQPAWALGSFDSREWITLRWHTLHNLRPGCEQLRSWQLDICPQSNGELWERVDSSWLYPPLPHPEHGQSLASPAKCAPLLSKQKGEACLIHLHTTSTPAWEGKPAGWCENRTWSRIIFPRKSIHDLFSEQVTGDFEGHSRAGVAPRTRPPVLEGRLNWPLASCLYLLELEHQLPFFFLNWEINVVIAKVQRTISATFNLENRKVSLLTAISINRATLQVVMISNRQK